jgi:predicted dehydrogenase
LNLARQLGAEEIFDADDDKLAYKISLQTGGRMADCAIFCAAAEQSGALSQASSLLRRKGRLVMVGVWGEEFKRDDVYAKEIDFLISCSYGPGRYDPSYEEDGLDYPYAYVRWTENRNMQEYLRLLSCGAVDVSVLLERSFPLERVDEAFALLKSKERPLLITLNYGPPPDLSLVKRPDELTRKIFIKNRTGKRPAAGLTVAVVGAGSYAASAHLPNLKAGSFNLKAVCSRTGHKAGAMAARFRAEYATTSYDEILQDPDIEAVIICTRHNLHGAQVLAALKAGKHVLAEKPLALTDDDLESVKNFYAGGPEGRPLLCVGFNRRFSRYARAVKKALHGPLIMTYRMNAGFLPGDHWVHGPEGGGRIVGEACHIFDLFQYFVDAPVCSMSVAAMRPSAPFKTSDNKIISLEYMDGSIGSIAYYAVGSADMPKERLEISWQGSSAVIDNYQSLKAYGCELEDLSDRQPDKGQKELLDRFGQAALNGGPWPISLDNLMETSHLAIRAQKGC